MCRGPLPEFAGVYPLGDGGPATGALLESPRAVAADLSGTMYIADTGNGVIRKVSGGVISTLARVSGYIYDLKLDAGGNLYVAAGSNAFTVTPVGIVTKIAGNGSGTFSGDGGPATSAGLSAVEGIAIDGNGNVYLCDTYNNRIREVTADGIIHTIAGGDGAGLAATTGPPPARSSTCPLTSLSADAGKVLQGPAAAALLHRPEGTVVSSDGSIYFTDTANHRVRKIAPDGTIGTIAGMGDQHSSGDPGAAAQVGLYNPASLAIDLSDNLFVVDGAGCCVRKITAAGVSPSYIGLYQVNLRVPAGVASGKQPIVITVGTNQSPTLGYLTMQ